MDARASGPNKSMLKEAVDAVLTTFAKHTKGRREVDVIETLEDFWRSKRSSNKSTDKMEISYEYETSGNAPYICYVTLPGGSCFGSFQYCLTKIEAQRSAAKIALMNSVFNEHPSRLITDAFIEQAVVEAKSSSNDEEDLAGIEMYRHMLCENKNATMLEFQSCMTIFQLLHWNDGFKLMKELGLTRNDVIRRYLNKELDREIRNEMASDWAKKHEKDHRKLRIEIAKAKQELEDFRLAGRELRFFKEKQDILTLALKNSSRV